MTTNEIRARFLSFFKSQAHRVLASDSLVPKDDPTVLFTTAGMQQFKPQFLGRIDGFTRAATAQKCLRTDDLDCVGKTDFHHTFFEMLGNFSFGDYFKKDAIHWAWEFLTQDLGLAREFLWVSVYKDDEEAYMIWASEIKVPLDRIVKLGDKSNFWPSNARLSGPNGPCGPCSEIFYDYGVNPKCPLGDKCDPDCSCGRFSEVWNLVFTQFNRKDGGVLEPLPAKNIDTGMGLERLAAVMQGKKSNYETDNFVAILRLIKLNIPGITEADARIIADHMRAIVFAIGDGIVPSNKERGSVVKKLISTVADINLRNNGMVLFSDLVFCVIDSMKNAYPELKNSEGEIEKYVRMAVEDYEKVFSSQIPELKKRILYITGSLNLNSPDNKIMELGRLFFFFRDTHGLSIATIRDTAISAGVSVAGVEKALSVLEVHMEEQRQRSRASSKMMGDVFVDQGADWNVPKTEFLGYSEVQAQAKVLKIFSENGEVKEAGKGSVVRVVLDRTPFYAESGGQVGDTGCLTASTSKARVTDTQKSNDIFVHSGVVEEGMLKAGDQVQAVVDEKRRCAIMRNHTATHLLQTALREVLGPHVKQQGSLVDENRLRFDFTHHQGVKPQELERIESRLNAFIAAKDEVQKQVLPIEEARQKGALAFFAEKYGDVVRVISIGDYSTEFCGGTHVSNTAKIEAVKISSEGSVAQGIRRVEAVTGKAAVRALLNKKQVEEDLRRQAQVLKEQEKQRQRERFESIKSSVDVILKEAEEVNGTSVITYTLDDADMGMLRGLSDLLKQKAKSAVLILGAKNQTDAALIVSATDDVVAKGFKANELVGSIALLISGSGGGRPNMAQAGGKGVEHLDAALAKAKEIVISSLQ